MSFQKNTPIIQISVTITLSAGTIAAGFSTKLTPVAGFHRASPSTTLDKDIQFVSILADMQADVKVSGKLQCRGVKHRLHIHRFLTECFCQG